MAKEEQKPIPTKIVVKAVTPGSVTAKMLNQPEVSTQKRIVVSSSRISQPVVVVDESDGVGEKPIEVQIRGDTPKPAFVKILTISIGMAMLVIGGIVGYLKVMGSKALEPQVLQVPVVKPVDAQVDKSMAPAAGGPTKGLIGHWAFDGDLRDSSGKGDHGTMETEPVFVAGKMGQGIKFSGEEAVQVIPPNSYDSLDEELSISFWAKIPEGFTQSAMMGYVTRGKSSLRIFGGKPEFSRFNFTVFDGGQVPTVWGKDIKEDYYDRWIHVVGVKEQNYLRVYVDGHLNQSKKDAAGAVHKTTAPIWIGGNFHFPADHNSPRMFIGEMDDVRIYNRALAPGEVVELFNLGEQ